MLAPMPRSAVWVLLLLAACSGGRDAGVTLTISASAVGAEGTVLRAQLERYMRERPGVRVAIHPTPDGADNRHQLYVQWLNARAGDPDVLQVDIIWTAELAAAGWLLPFDRFGLETADFFPAAIRADTWEGSLYAVPWFADVGMLYYRTDLVPRAPATVDELVAFAAAARREHGVEGFVWQGARYEGLTCTFLEQLGAFGGSLDDVDTPAARRALEHLRRLVTSGISPIETLNFDEERVRFAFQNGHAAFMRNWPYALALVNDPRQSRVAGRVAVAPMPAAPGGRPTATLGGGQLAINAHSEHADEAWRLIAWLTAPAQMRDRLRVAGQYPTRPALHEDANLRRIVEAGEPRPVTPVYAELSERLQIQLHRALTGQVEPAAALAEAAAGMRAVKAKAERRPEEKGAGVLAVILLVVGLAVVAALLRRRPPAGREARAAWALMAPALGIVVAVAVFPLGWSVWESLHAHDLRLAWTGRPFVGLDNYLEAFAEPRFRAALGQTLFFTFCALILELLLGLALAMALDRAFRGRGLARAAVLLPWALPTVVAALLWRFLFDGPMFARAATAWVPVILADVWKTSPFVALLVLAGLQTIDPALHEAARLDGATAWQRFRHVTLPLLRPTLLVAALLRALDAFRVFDLIYVMTSGGPGTATESLALYSYSSLMTSLRFGYGSALAVLTFVGALVLALVFVRALGAEVER